MNVLYGSLLSIPSLKNIINKTFKNISDVCEYYCDFSSSTQFGLFDFPYL